MIIFFALSLCRWVGISFIFFSFHKLTLRNVNVRWEYERLSPLTILQRRKHKDVDIDNIVTEFASLAWVISFMKSLFTLFRHKHCTLPIALEIGKISNYLLHFSFSNTENAKNARNGISETLIYKLFCGSTPPHFPSNSFPVRTPSKSQSTPQDLEQKMIVHGEWKTLDL